MMRAGRRFVALLLAVPLLSVPQLATPSWGSAPTSGGLGRARGGPRGPRDSDTGTRPLPAVEPRLEPGAARLAGRRRFAGAAPVPDWPTVGAAGAAQRTSDLASVVLEVVSRPGWAGGNAVVLLVTGSAHRTADSFDGRHAPVLHIEWHL